MNPKTLTALRGSIDKWRRIEAGEIADLGTENCALCAEFIKEDCADCPVLARTGDVFCQYSPYMKWGREQKNLEREISSGEWIADTPELKALARAEREFLESLLPKETK